MRLKLFLRDNIWHYRGTIAKRRLRGSTGIPKERKKEALRAVAAIEHAQWECDSSGAQSVLTFAQAALMYRKAGKSDTNLEPIEDYFKNRLVKEITPAMIREMAMKLFGHCSGASRNRVAIVPTRAVINFAAANKKCAQIRVELFKIETAEKDFATLEWVQAFSQHASPYLGALALFMFLTGARVSEAMAAEVDLTNATTVIRASKVGHEREAHLPEMLVAALANLPKVAGRPTFYYTNLSLLRLDWDAAIKRAGIKRLTPHCCRHGFITGLLRKGIDVKTISWLADVTAETLLNTYAHAIKDRTLTDVLTDTDLTRSNVENARNQRRMGST